MGSFNNKTVCGVALLGLLGSLLVTPMSGFIVVLVIVVILWLLFRRRR